MTTIFVWTFSDIISALAFSVLGIGLLGYGIISIRQRIKQSRCPHNNFHETSSCDAICSSCGKNLGFIGAWRQKQRSK